MIGKSVAGWHWQWKGEFLRLWSPSGNVAAVIGFNLKLGWMWSLPKSLGNKTKNAELAVREALNKLEMPERVRAELLSIVLRELVRLKKLEAENEFDGGEGGDDDKPKAA